MDDTNKVKMSHHILSGTYFDSHFFSLLTLYITLFHTFIIKKARQYDVLYEINTPIRNVKI